MAIRSPFHALITYPLQYGVRIATPVCALARNDMLLNDIKGNLSKLTVPESDTERDREVTIMNRLAHALSAATGCPQIVRKIHPEFVIFSEILLDNPQ